MQTPKRLLKNLAFSLIAGSGLLLTACGGGGGGGGAATSSASCPAGTTVCGTAATGRPMASANISLRCKNGSTPSTTAGSNGEWGLYVPVSDQPCVVKASDGTNSYYSVTPTTGNNVITNISPLTSLALAQALGIAPDDTWFAGLSESDLNTLVTNLPAAIALLNTALTQAGAGYALPADFNPISSLLAAASATQTGNDHDNLLEQFGAALGAGNFNDLLTDLANYEDGDASPLPVPSYTEGASTYAEFFEKFAGEYTLKVANSGVEGGNNAAVQNLFPKDSARVVHIKPNGDVVIDAVGRSITINASTYPRDVANTNTVPAWAEFQGFPYTQNTVHYRVNSGHSIPTLYMTYNPANGELRVSPSGFSNNEGYALLTGTIFVPPPVVVPPVTPPTISSFTPASGAVGDTVTITGTGFSSTLANNIVRFSTSVPDLEAPQATVVSGTTTQLVVTVPAGAMTGGISVYNTEAEAFFSSGDSFTVTASSGNAPVGPLGNAISNVWAGNYSLQCATSFYGGTTQSFAVTISPNGDATLDGQALLDAAHPGGYTLTRLSDNSTTLKVGPAIGDHVLLGFKADGSFSPVNVVKNSTTYYCSSYAGHTAPSSSPTSVLTNAASDLARSENLSCTQGSVTEPRMLAINSDGSAQLETLSFTNSNISFIRHSHHEATYALRQIQYSLAGVGTLTIDLNADMTTNNAAGIIPSEPSLSCTP